MSRLNLKQYQRKDNHVAKKKRERRETQGKFREWWTVWSNCISGMSDRVLKVGWSQIVDASDPDWKKVHFVCTMGKPLRVSERSGDLIGSVLCKGLAGGSARPEGDGDTPEPQRLVLRVMPSVRLNLLGLSTAWTIPSKKPNRTPLLSDRTVLDLAYRKTSTKYCGMTRSVMKSD